MSECIVLGLGSNRTYNGLSCTELLSEACTMLSSFIEKIRFSSVYKSRAMYLEDQDDFYNMAAAGFFNGSPEELLEKIHQIENKLGRNRSLEVRNGSRSMDIDIELFGKHKIHTETLIVPHERLLERAFVLKPLLEILRKDADNFSNGTCSGARDALEGQFLYGTDFLEECVLSESVSSQKIELFCKPVA